jgi:hypothetical protein
MPLTPTSTNDGIVLTDLSVAILGNIRKLRHYAFLVFDATELSVLLSLNRRSNLLPPPQ